MKKLLSILLILAMLALPMLSACGTPDKELDAIDKINLAMDSVSSYESYGEVDITAYVAGDKLELEGTYEQVVSGNDGELYYYNKSIITTEYMGYSMEYYTLEAYNDGTYYYALGEDDSKRRFCSDITAEEFLSYITAGDSDDAPFEGYGSISDIANPNGGRTVTLSDYDDSVLEDFNARFGLPVEEGGTEITGFSAVINVTDGYLVNDITMDFEFSDTASNGKMTYTFFNYNVARVNSDRIMPSLFKKVPDARIIPMTERFLSDSKSSEYGAFSFNQKTDVFIRGVTSLKTENSYRITYMEADGYWFEMNVAVEDETHQHVYRKGVYTVDGEPDTDTDMDDQAAKRLIGGFIDPFSFNQMSVLDIAETKGENDRLAYKIYLVESRTLIAETMNAIYGEMGGYCTSANMYIEVVADGYEIMSVTYYITSCGRIAVNRQTFEVDVELAVTTDFSENNR